MSSTRTRRDRCPGVLRPWPAEDGALVRVRLAGGRLSATQLHGLAGLAAELSDGELHLTSRANVQLRAVTDVALLGERLEHVGLLPSRAHDLARNIVASPFSGLRGGRADVRPLVDDLDRRLCADEALGALPGRFLFTFDDGRGDVIDRGTDLGAVVLDDGRWQLRVGAAWGPVIAGEDVVAELLALAHEFLDRRGDGVDAAWHVLELPSPLVDTRSPHPSVPVPTGAPAYDTGHVAVLDGVLSGDQLADLLSSRSGVVVTPWRSVVVEELAA